MIETDTDKAAIAPRAPRPGVPLNDRLLEAVERVSAGYLVLCGVAIAAGLLAIIAFAREDTQTSAFSALVLFNLAALASIGMIALSMVRSRYFAGELSRGAGLFALGLVYAGGIVFDVMYIMFTLVFGFFGGSTTYLDNVPGWPH